MQFTGLSVRHLAYAAKLELTSVEEDSKGSLIDYFSCAKELNDVELVKVIHTESRTWRSDLPLERRHTRNSSRCPRSCSSVQRTHLPAVVSATATGWWSHDAQQKHVRQRMMIGIQGREMPMHSTSYRLVVMAHHYVLERDRKVYCLPRASPYGV